MGQTEWIKRYRYYRYEKKKNLKTNVLETESRNDLTHRP